MASQIIETNVAHLEIVGKTYNSITVKFYIELKDSSVYDYASYSPYIIGIHYYNADDESGVGTSIDYGEEFSFLRGEGNLEYTQTFTGLVPDTKYTIWAKNTTESNYGWVNLYVYPTTEEVGVVDVQMFGTVTPNSITLQLKGFQTSGEDYVRYIKWEIINSNTSPVTYIQENAIGKNDYSSSEYTIDGLKSSTRYTIVAYIYSSKNNSEVGVVSNVFTTLAEYNPYVLSMTSCNIGVYDAKFGFMWHNSEYESVMFSLRKDTEDLAMRTITVECEYGDDISLSVSFEGLESNTKYWLYTNLSSEIFQPFEFTTLNAVESAGNLDFGELTVSSLDPDDLKVYVYDIPCPSDVGCYGLDCQVDIYQDGIKICGGTLCSIVNSEEPSNPETYYPNKGSTTYLKEHTTYLIEATVLFYRTYDDWNWMRNEVVKTKSIIITTSSPYFYWTYAGLKKNDSGVFESVKGDNKGDNGAEYFYITADEWNEYVTKLCETKDNKDGLDIGNELLVDLKVLPDYDFTATLFNNVLGILQIMEDPTVEPTTVEPGDDITAACLNDIKNRLNAIIDTL